MTASNAVTIYQQHAQLRPPAKHTAATVAPARDRVPADQHYSPEAVGAMTVVGAVTVFICAVALLLLIRMVRGTFARKRTAQPAVSKPPYRGTATVLTFIATAKQGKNGHDGLQVEGVLNEDYHAHIRKCKECRETIVTDLHEFAEQIDHDIDARAN